MLELLELQFSTVEEFFFFFLKKREEEGGGRASLDHRLPGGATSRRQGHPARGETPRPASGSGYSVIFYFFIFNFLIF